MDEIPSSKVSIMKRIPFRWSFEVCLKSDPLYKIGETRFLQVETREEALDVARRYLWIKQIEQSKFSNELTYLLLPVFKD
tara:strand:- start:96 stop:335 length:240 start_codon:yes stop_codon:yes gene_type:complete